MATQLKNPYTGENIKNPYEAGGPTSNLPQGSISESGVVTPAPVNLPNESVPTGTQKPSGGDYELFLQQNQTNRTTAEQRLAILRRLVQLKSGNVGDKTGMSPETITGSGVVTSSEQVRATEDAAKQEQARATQAQTAEQDAELAKLTRQKQINDLKVSMGLEGAEIPKAPTLVSDYENLRSERGIGQLETAIQDVDRQIAELDLATREEKLNLSEGLATTGIISARQSAAYERAQIAKDSLNLKKAILVDEMNTKNSVINTIMNLKKEEYGNAVAEYNNKFNQAIQINSALSSYKSNEEASANRLRDDARANINMVVNSVKGSGQGYDSLDEGVKASLNKMALQSGIDVSLIKSVINNSSVSEIISTQSGYDESGNEVISFIVRDKNGNPEILKQVKPGTVAPKTVPGTESGGTIFTSESTGKDYDLSSPTDVANYKKDTGVSWIRMAAIMDQSLTKIDAKTRSAILNRAGMGNFIDYTFIEGEIRTEMGINDDAGKRFKKLINEYEGGSEDEKIANYVYDKIIPQIKTMKDEGLSDTEIANKLF